MDLTRRESLAFGATLLAGAAAQAAGARGAESLNQDAKSKGRRFGSAVGLGWPGRIGGAFADPDYRRIVAAQCGLIVPENELKWRLAARPPDRLRFLRRRPAARLGGVARAGDARPQSRLASSQMVAGLGDPSRFRRAARRPKPSGC